VGMSKIDLTLDKKKKKYPNAMKREERNRKSKDG
jgi:hypothetical protein